MDAKWNPGLRSETARHAASRINRKAHPFVYAVPSQKRLIPIQNNSSFSIRSLSFVYPLRLECKASECNSAPETFPVLHKESMHVHEVPNKSLIQRRTTDVADLLWLSEHYVNISRGRCCICLV